MPSYATTYGEWAKTSCYGDIMPKADWAKKHPGEEYNPDAVAFVVTIPEGMGIFGVSSGKKDDKITYQGGPRNNSYSYSDGGAW